METTSVEEIRPCLPHVQPQDPKSNQGLLTFVLLFLLAVTLGLLARYGVPADTRAALEGPDILRLSGIATLLAAVAASIVLHEAGHLLAAVLVNFEILSVAMGPFRLTRSNGAWRFRFALKSLVSGSVSAVPRTVDGWRSCMLLIVGAGPVATFASGLTGLVVLLAHANGPIPNTFLGALTQLSLVIFVLGLIPNGRNAPVRNDARLLLVLLEDSKEAHDIFVYHLLTRLELDGTRPRDYPDRLIFELAEQQGRPDLMLFGSHKITLWALDREQYATADAWDERCLELSESCLPASRNLALAHSACLDVLVRDRPRDAAEKLAVLDWEGLSPLWLMHRVRAVQCLTVGNVPECLAEISRAEHVLPNKLPIYTFERNLLTQLHRRALKVKPPELAKGCAA